MALILNGLTAKTRLGQLSSPVSATFALNSSIFRKRRRFK
jgi:hypothetical protein